MTPWRWLRSHFVQQAAVTSAKERAEAERRARELEARVRRIEVLRDVAMGRQRHSGSEQGR